MSTEPAADPSATVPWSCARGLPRPVCGKCAANVLRRGPMPPEPSPERHPGSHSGRTHRPAGQATAPKRTRRSPPIQPQGRPSHLQDLDGHTPQQGCTQAPGPGYDGPRRSDGPTTTALTVSGGAGGLPVSQALVVAKD